MKKVNVATKETVSFNTASGRCCCNSKMISIWSTSNVKVSIPQAVGAVATVSEDGVKLAYGVQFQYRKR